MAGVFMIEVIHVGIRRGEQRIVNDIVRKAMEVDKLKRYGSMDELRIALEQAA
mgnify:CR=1 FL=1